MADPIPVIIDTDIGEDIDDLLATSFVLNSPEFELLAITTVDCDTASRSRIARRVTKAYKREDIPVARGYTRSMPVGPQPTKSESEVELRASLRTYSTKPLPSTSSIVKKASSSSRNSS